jgi:microcystin-dependent protein
MFNGLVVPNITGGTPSAGGGETSPRRVEGNEAVTLGGTAGQAQYGLQLQNLPEHTHTLNNAGRQYSAVRLDTSVNLPATPGLGPTAPGAAQYFSEAGPVKKPNDATQLGQPLPLMNPYLTINYIIRTGPPAFTTTSLT